MTENIILAISIGFLSGILGGFFYDRFVIFKQKEKLEKIKEYANHLEVFTYIKKDLLNIIEGAEDDKTM